MRTQIVIIGGGFAGLACARGLAKSDVDVKLIDKRNFHLFQPLLYQVATGSLSPANIAAPLRSIFRRQKNCQVLLAEVAEFDTGNRRVSFNDGSSLAYDYLVLATGSTHHYFGQDALWEPLAPGLKTIEDATEIRQKILSSFEAAERMGPCPQRTALLTFVVVGGGPTGVEMAGSICELAKQTMKNDFREIDPRQAKVILIENSAGILTNFHESLGLVAKKALSDMGAEVWTGTRLLEIHPDHVTVGQNDQQMRIDTHTVIWAAGVKASPLGKKLVDSLGPPAALDRAGRVIVDKACAIPGNQNIFVLGDVASFTNEAGKPLPGVAPVAMQQGRYAAELIASTLAGTPISKSFEYLDKGNMATIGRSHAVVETGKIRLTGRIAWLAWLFIHILYLASFENRILVIFQWLWNFITRNRASRLITGPHAGTK